MNRQLAAIMFADMVGYTALMQEDERRAMLLRDRQRKVLEHRVAEFEGEIVQFYGDGALCVFQSAIQAVECAAAIQVDFGEEPPVPVRIGIHLGDIAHDQAGVYGDGVNIASRIQALAVPGGVLVSGKIADEVKNQPDITIEPLAHVALKNVKQPQQIFAVTNADLAIPTPKDVRGWARVNEKGWTGRTWGKVTGLGALMATLAGLLYFWWPNPPGPGPVGPGLESLAQEAVAIVPFQFIGPEDFDYLGPGAATQLSAALTSGVFIPVDQTSIRSFVDRLGPDAPRGHEFREEIAERFSADLVLDGTVTVLGESLSTTAYIYSPRDGAEAVFTESAEGGTGDSPSVFKELAGKLLLVVSGADPTLLGGLVTESDEALRAWVDGNVEYRAGNYPRAVELLEEATESDPDFALAHYRLSQAALWAWDFPLARNSAGRARERGSGLSPRHRFLFDAWYEFLESRPERAEQRYLDLLVPTPTVEVTAGLAEVYVHFNLLRGDPTSDAEPWFNKALDLDPNYGEVRFHLLEFAARERDQARFDSLVAGVDPTSDQALAWKAVRAFAWGTNAEQRSVIEQLSGADEREVEIAAGRIAAFLHDFAAADSIARLLEMPGRPRNYQEGMAGFFSMLKVARGEWGRAKSDLLRTRRVEKEWALEMQGLISTFPLLQLPDAEIQALRDTIEAWNPADSTHTPTIIYVFGAHHGVHDQLRSYVLALLSVKLGDFEAAEEYRRALWDSARSRESQEFAQALSHSVTAHIEYERGDYEAALSALERVGFFPKLELIPTSPFYSRALDRWLRAELLRELGREEEAQLWYATLTDGLYEFLFAAPAHLRQAQVHDELGEVDAAIAHYQRFEELWAGADPVLQPLVEGARAARERLTGAGGSV